MSANRSTNLKTRELINKFASIEALAHNHAYLHYENNSNIKILEEDGLKKQYTVNNIQTNHSGLVCKILTPTDNINTRSNKHKPIEIKLLFRGTHCFHSGARIFQPYGPGLDSLTHSIELIDQQLIDVISKLEDKIKPIKLTIAGHSLGGADSQNYITYLMEKLDNIYNSNNPNIKNHPLTRIKHLNLGIKCSTGVDEKISTLSNNVAKNLQNHNVKLEANIIMVAGDGIQQTGASAVFNNIDPKYCKLNFVKIKRPEGIWKVWWRIDQIIRALLNTLRGHNSQYFNSFGNSFKSKAFEYEFYTNDNKNDYKNIQDNLNTKSFSHYDSHWTIIATLDGIYNLFDRFVQKNYQRQHEQAKTKQHLSKIIF